MGNINTPEYAAWEVGLNEGIDCCIDIVKRNRTLSHKLKQNLIKKMEKEKE